MPAASAAGRVISAMPATVTSSPVRSTSPKSANAPVRSGEAHRGALLEDGSAAGEVGPAGRFSSRLLSIIVAMVSP